MTYHMLCLNNYFNFHVCLSFHSWPLLLSLLCPKTSSNFYIRIKKFSDKSYLICFKSEKHSSWITLWLQVKKTHFHVSLPRKSITVVCISIPWMYTMHYLLNKYSMFVLWSKPKLYQFYVCILWLKSKCLVWKCTRKNWYSFGFDHKTNML